MIVTDENCQYCWRPTAIGGHNEGCPLTHEPEAMAEWKRGHAYGWQDNNIEWWQYQHYSKTFMLGWRAGKDAIDELVDIAALSYA
jgi:hypothetical protein